MFAERPMDFIVVVGELVLEVEQELMKGLFGLASFSVAIEIEFGGFELGEGFERVLGCLEWKATWDLGHDEDFSKVRSLFMLFLKLAKYCLTK